MGRRILESVKMGPSANTYISSVYGVLKGARLWKADITQLMGMTGMAFRFALHKELCPSSVTAYDWANTHFIMMDRIGIHSEVFQVNNSGTLNTFSRIQKTAIARIKASIDRGIAVVAWAPSDLLEFGIIKGYDDQDRVLIVDCCTTTGRKGDYLPYEHLGLSEVPYLFYQIFYDAVEVDPESVYRDSLKYGLQQWNNEPSSTSDYASGRRAYRYLMDALNSGNFSEFGLCYIFRVYAEAKRHIADYLHFLNGTSRTLGDLQDAVDCYQEVAEAFDRLRQLAPFSGAKGTTFNRKNLPEIRRLAARAAAFEAEAIEAVARSLAR